MSRIRENIQIKIPDCTTEIFNTEITMFGVRYELFSFKFKKGTIDVQHIVS